MTELSTAGWEKAYDGVDWQKMPTDGEHFLYVDGDYTAPPEAHQAYPHAITIAVDPGTPADEYDVENGNPNHPVTWAIMMRQQHGYIGRIYCNLATIPWVLDQFTTGGIAPPRFRIADWAKNGVPEAVVPDYGSGTDGVQYATGPDYDTSLLRPGAPRYTRPATPPAPAPTPEEDMKNHCTILRVLDKTEVFVINWPAGKLWHVGDTPSLQNYINAGVEQITIEAEELATYQKTYNYTA